MYKYNFLIIILSNHINISFYQPYVLVTEANVLRPALFVAIGLAIGERGLLISLR